MSRYSKTPLILVINPGSTSTKMALFRGSTLVFEKTAEHSRQDLANFRQVIDQADYRGAMVMAELQRHQISLDQVNIFMGRGGLLRPLAGGVYAVDEAMLRDLREGRYGEHASNLGAIIAHQLALGTRAPCLIANPVVVDELAPEARLTGHPDIERRSIFHALNQKAVAEQVAGKIGKAYGRCHMIVAHIGGGLSVGVHRKGRVIDVNNALEGDGPFSPERTGSMPVLDFYKYAVGKNLSVSDVARLISRGGGLLAHLGTNDCRVIVKQIQAGDRKSKLVLDAFVFQLAKAIGAGAAVLDGKVDAIVLTGNVMKSSWVRTRLCRKIKFIAPLYVITGNSEMEALAKAGLDAWLGKKKVLNY